jgi:hypothetical protein
MKRYAIALLGCLIAAPALGAAQQKDLFLMVTGSDIGRPYKVVNGLCMFQMNPRFLNPSTSGMLNSAMVEASKQIMANAQKQGADALVNMVVTPMLIPDPDNPRDLITNGGVFICGTLVQSLAQNREANLQ